VIDQLFNFFGNSTTNDGTNWEHSILHPH
jgi:hypothetical protein